MISGSTTQTVRHGVYRLTTTISNGKSVYKQSNGDNYLYYWKSFDRWRVGPSYSQVDAGLYAHTEVGSQLGSCPPNTNQWRQYSGGDWKASTAIQVGCGTFSVRPHVCVSAIALRSRARGFVVFLCREMHWVVGMGLSRGKILERSLKRIHDVTRQKRRVAPAF